MHPVGVLWAVGGLGERFRPSSGAMIPFKRRAPVEAVPSGIWTHRQEIMSQNMVHASEAPSRTHDKMHTPFCVPLPALLVGSRSSHTTSTTGSVGSKQHNKWSRQQSEGDSA